MTLSDDPTTQDLYERALAATTEAQRAALLRDIDAHLPLEREHWTALLAEAAWVRTALADVPVPPDLSATLMRFPPAPAAPWWRRLGQQPVTWKPLAVLLTLGIAIAVYLSRPASTPAPALLLDSAVANHLATLAMGHQTAGPATATAPAGSLDPQQAMARLHAQQLPFQPALPRACVPMELQDAGIVTFGTTPAAFTRWQAGAARYTLYQVDGNAFHLPARFAQTAGDAHAAQVQVVIWQGNQGACGWVLVAENAPPGNPFETY